jgi:hypothetical protein
MNEESHDVDRLLSSAWRDLAADRPATPDAEELGQAILRRAAPELARRRARARRRWLIAPLALAASIALLLYSVPLPPASGGGRAVIGAATDAGGERQSVERLLDADVSDRQFRALLFGATDADELLLIAAGDSRQRPDEAR